MHPITFLTICLCRYIYRLYVVLMYILCQIPIIQQSAVCNVLDSGTMSVLLAVYTPAHWILN